MEEIRSEKTRRGREDVKMMIVEGERRRAVASAAFDVAEQVEGRMIHCGAVS